MSRGMSECDSEQEISNWTMIAEQILHPTKGNKDLKRALDKVWEISEHDENVRKAFAQGKKPPIKFSDCEFKEM